ncbi:MAG: phosphate/phosphite/phosphonate ABC transporter substrate-binding protein [Polyangiaceae bacterium]
MTEKDRIVLGLVPSDRLSARDPQSRTFTRALGDHAGTYVVERNVSSYEELEREMVLGRIDLAWLPPMVFAHLQRDGVAVALATRLRRPREYWSVLVTARSSGLETLQDLKNKRIAWVDRLSASGYAVPRIGLIGRGYDPRTTFSKEFFAGSHNEAVRAVFERRADVAATFAFADADGALRGPWSEIGVAEDDVRIVATLGEVPPDLIAARTSVSPEMREALTTSLLKIAADPALAVAVESVFGGRDFERSTTATYATLADLIDRAAKAGLEGLGDAYLSTLPPVMPPSKK